MPPSLRRNLFRAAPAPLLALALFAGTLWLACGDSGPTGAASCSADPFTCGAGTTCWPTDQTGGASCLPSKSYKARGDDCELILGDTSCGDGLVCASASTLKLDGSVVQSFCTSYCDMARGKGCVGDETCMKLMLFDGGPAVSVCVPQSLPRDHAMDGGP